MVSILLIKMEVEYWPISQIIALLTDNSSSDA